MKFETPEEFVQEIYKASADSGTMDAEIAKLIASRDAALTAKVCEECAERAIAWRHKKYSCTVPGVDEELAAAIIGKEGEE